MRIDIACPAPPGTHNGNRATAERWRRLLGELGHSVRIVHDGEAGPGDLLVALHATRSAAAAELFRSRAPRSPVVFALAGTDLYRDLPRTPGAWRSLDDAWRVVVLHPLAPKELPEGLRGKTRVILQSATPPRSRPPRRRRSFDVAVVGHLRGVKDPFRAEEAVRGLPATSRLRVHHVGGSLERGMDAQARRRAAANPRYVWLGDRPAGEARRLIARSRLLVLSSRLEGGANVVSEAVVSGVPVLATRIACTRGLLGEDYPGLFGVGDTAALRELLQRAEGDPGFYRELERRCRLRRRLFAPSRERAAWRALLAELG